MSQIWSEEIIDSMIQNIKKAIEIYPKDLDLFKEKMLECKCQINILKQQNDDKLLPHQLQTVHQVSDILHKIIAASRNDKYADVDATILARDHVNTKRISFAEIVGNDSGT